MLTMMIDVYIYQSIYLSIDQWNHHVKKMLSQPAQLSAITAADFDLKVLNSVSPHICAPTDPALWPIYLYIIWNIVEDSDSSLCISTINISSSSSSSSPLTHHHHHHHHHHYHHHHYHIIIIITIITNTIIIILIYSILKMNHYNYLSTYTYHYEIRKVFIQIPFLHLLYCPINSGLHIRDTTLNYFSTILMWMMMMMRIIIMWMIMMIMIMVMVMTRMMMRRRMMRRRMMMMMIMDVIIIVNDAYDDSDQ